MTDKILIEQIAREYIEKLVLTSKPMRPKWNRENYIFRKQSKWNYMDSCMIRALMMYGDNDYIDYAVKFTDSYVNEDGSIPTMNVLDYNLDNICGGINLINLYNVTGAERYRLAYERIYIEQLIDHPRLKCGSFWHKAIYPNQMWLDGAYMVLPFMSMYGKIKNDKSIINDAISQMMNIRNIMRDRKTGLYYHGYNETKDMLWADEETGLSSQFWLRSNGWLCAGLADMYEITENEEIGEMFREHIEALSQCLTEENMLLQLPVRKLLAGNYPETSGTLLYAYGAMKGYRLGTVDKSAAKSGEKALYAVTEKYIDRSGEIPVLRNICLMGGLGGANNRDGSAEYYLSERIVENEAKGIAPYLMATAELIKSYTNP
ncbi:MAG: glycoside hydrolase family 88 protein [Ruminococcus sp.]|nr:glycoside hydrolase family 88 protein [Ruminococcus sp.]